VGEQRGAFVVIGWSGQWASQFRRGDDGLLHITGGQELTHLKLLPGEEVRTPLSVLMFWRGDLCHAHNLWRRWMMACNMPRPGGKLPAPFMPAGTSLWFNEMTQATEENQKYFINRYLEEGIQLDYWWMDAGWYPCEGNWPKTGTWDVDTKRFPRGLRAVADHVHPEGINVLVWFEPERVAPGTWLYEKRPQWLLTCKGSDNRLLDLGNPEARQWLTDHVDGVINEQGIDLYRQDFNFDPLAYWRANDAPDRQGITEIRHVEGYLAYWDELQRRHPDMLIDSCASGGRRNDLETMRRSVPLHKTDYNYSDLPVKQAFHHTLSLWLPYYGAPVLPVEQVDAYAFRSAFAPMTAVGYDLRRKDLDYALLRKLTQEWRRIAHYYYGDFYPLTPFSRSDDTWMAWQFHMPDKGDGMVQAFRRAQSPFVSASFKLHGLNARASYQVTNLDAPGKVTTMSGKELMETGLAVVMKQAPQAVTLVYTRKR